MKTAGRREIEMSNNRFSKAGVKKLVKREALVNIVEIGAHRGVQTNRFLKMFPRAAVYCFEPDPRCVKHFKKNVHSGRCKLIEAAVAKESGVAALNISSGYPGIKETMDLYTFPYYIFAFIRQVVSREREWDLSSTIKRPISRSFRFPWLVFEKTIEVNAVSLSDWIDGAGIKRIDLMWVDVQGAERDVISGGAKALEITEYLHIEYGETDCYPDAMTREETISLLGKHNFAIVAKYSDVAPAGDLLFKNTGTPF